MMKLYINGECVEGRGQPFNVINPATEEVVDTVRAADQAVAIEALEAAQVAFETWSKTSISTRLGWIARLRDAIIAERDTLVDLVAREAGKSYVEAHVECDQLVSMLDFYSEEVKRVYGTVVADYVNKPGETLHIIRRHPVGVVVGHLAWNFPLWNVASKLAPSLASGCTCVLKPSTNTPLATLYLGVIAEKIGFPKGVFNVVAGPSSVVGKTLNQSKIPRMIGLVGSTETGHRVMSEASTSIKRFSLELGGNAPAVVMPDADLESTADFMVVRKTQACGQGCTNLNRIYVHESVHDKFIDLLLQNVQKVKVGWGRELGNAMGSMINKQARDRVLGLIKDATDKGAKVVYGGKIPENLPVGSFLMPTLLDNAQDNMRVCHEEIFGPVLVVYIFRDLDEVITRANDTTYGLCSYLFSHDSRVIARVSEEFGFGMLLVNDPSVGNAGNVVPLPHVGIKESGINCIGSFWSLEPYFWLRRVSIVP